LTITPQIVQSELEWLTNNAYLVNDVTVTSTSTNSQRRARSATSLNSVGAYTQQVSLPFYDDDDLYQYANDLMTEKENKVVPPRVASLTIDVMAKQASVNVDTVLNSEIGDRIRVRDLPIGSPAPWMDLFIEGISQSIRTNEHTVTWATSPAKVTYTAQVVDNFTYGCVLETLNNWQLVNPITATQIYMLVSSASDNYLSLDAADYPLSLLVGNEIVTVTAAPTSTSPQYLVISRGVSPSVSSAWDSSTRAWPAGTKVSLYNDPRLALV
jgi:hypothetical protein